MAQSHGLAADVVSGFAAAGNIVLWLSQGPLMYQLVKEGDATRYSWLPSLTLVGTMSLWCGYTVWAIPTPQVMVANWTGVIIPLFYLCIFMYYSKTARARLRIATATTLVLIATWTFILAVYLGPPLAGGRDKNTVVGAVTATVNISFFLSPLKQIWLGIRELKLSRVPITLSAVAVVQSSLWVAAAVLLGDQFILLVNALGLGFACLQLSAIAYIVVASRRAHPGADAFALTQKSVDDSSSSSTPASWGASSGVRSALAAGASPTSSSMLMSPAGGGGSDAATTAAAAAAVSEGSAGTDSGPVDAGAVALEVTDGGGTGDGDHSAAP